MGAETSYDVFLSYNSLDHEYVERIAKELKSRGCTSFIDRWYMKPGRNWVEAGKGTDFVASAIVKAHGSDIFAERVESRGLSVGFTIPAVQAPNHD